MIIQHSVFLWPITVTVFFAVILIYVLGVYIVSALSPMLKTEKQAAPFTDRRRSERFEVRLPVLVYGYKADEEPFSENATVRQMSPHGGLVALATGVQVGQELLLETSGAQHLRQSCRVARVGTSDGLTKDVAFQFAPPAAEVWLARAKSS
jgi:hypothetical protein